MCTRRCRAGFHADLRNESRLETEPATFIGSADVLRRDLLGRALQGGADFVVRGTGWLGDGDSANGSQQSRSTQRALISNQIDLVKQHGFGGLLKKLSPACGLFVHRRFEESQIGAAAFDARLLSRHPRGDGYDRREPGAQCQSVPTSAVGLFPLT